MTYRFDASYIMYDVVFYAFLAIEIEYNNKHDGTV
jgi:hypothetical protein